MQDKESKKEGARNFRGLAYAGKESAVDFGQAVVNKAKGAPLTLVRMLLDPSFMDELVLSGTRQAFKMGIISEEELQEAVSAVKALPQQERGGNRFSRGLKGFFSWGGLYAYYHVSGSLLKIPEVAAYAFLSTQEDWLTKSAMLAGTFLGFRTIGGLQSYLATKSAGFLTKRNLDTAAKIAAIPALGPHLAIPAQICVDSGSKSKAAWHYTVRGAMAQITGWGSEWEGRLWNLVGKRLENWANPPR